MYRYRSVTSETATVYRSKQDYKTLTAFINPLTPNRLLKVSLHSRRNVNKKSTRCIVFVVETSIVGV